MSATGRPEREYRSAQHEGSPVKLFAIARFDFGRRLRQLSTWVYFALFATLAALWMAAAGGAFASARVGFGGDRIAIDGAHALAIGIGVLGFIGVTVIGSIAGRAVQQDFEHGTDHFFFTAPIARRDYFLGRLFGAIATLAVVFAGIAVGIAIGTHWPGIDPRDSPRSGPGSSSPGPMPSCCCPTSCGSPAASSCSLRCRDRWRPCTSPASSCWSATWWRSTSWATWRTRRSPR